MLALLAAGQSSRFGEADKIAAVLGDRMLGLHAAETAAAMPFTGKLVIGSPEHDCTAQWRHLGYRIIANADAGRGQASSVRLAAAHAIDNGASALCILLADMPFVTREHLDRLLAAFEQSDDTVASARNGQVMPPAIFPASRLSSLLALDGDAGARTLLAEARMVAGEDKLLMDVDTVEDLVGANRIYRNIK